MIKNNWPSFIESMQFNLNFVNSKKEIDKWKIVEDRYNTFKEQPTSTQKIPKILHQIWLGNQIPEQIYNRCMHLKKTIPADWQYKLWTDNDINQLSDFKNIDIFNKVPNPGQKSDILRNYILYKFGGVYCDTDFIIYRFFDELLDLDFFGGIVYDDVPNIANSIMGSSPGNILITDIQDFDIPVSYPDGIDIINSTGQGLITRKFFKNKDTLSNTLALPNSFVYPYPNFNNCKILGNNYASYIREETFCCHLWEGSWM